MARDAGGQHRVLRADAAEFQSGQSAVDVIAGGVIWPAVPRALNGPPGAEGTGEEATGDSGPGPVIGEAARRALDSIQNAGRLCYIAVVPPGLEASRRDVRSRRWRSLPDYPIRKVSY